MKFSFENCVTSKEGIIGDYIEVSESYARSVKDGYVLLKGDDEDILIPIGDTDSEGIKGQAAMTPKIVVRAQASLADVQEMLNLIQQVDDLTERIDEIKARIQMDASLALMDTAYGTYVVTAKTGSVEVTNKDSVDVLAPSSLKDVLRDKDGQLVTAKPVTYKLSPYLTQALIAIEKDAILDRTPEEVIDDLARRLGDDNLKYSETKKVLKKTFSTNVKVFMNTFGMDYDEAVDTATMFQMSQNWEILCKLAACAGKDVHSPKWHEEWRKFAEDLQDCVVVKQTAAMTVKK